jgi:SNF2 family DNA or RNA helicase
MARGRARAESSAEPYRLSIDESLGVICAMGPKKIIVDQASRMPGATMWPASESVPGPFVSVPMTRSAFLSLEALGSPEWCSDDYIRLRSQFMQPDPRYLDAFLAALAARGGDPTKLLQYQAGSGAQAFANGRGLLNASEQGTGKTRSTIATVTAMGAQKTIIAAPKSVCIEWGREAKKVDGLFAGSPPFYAVSYADGPMDWRASELSAWLSGPDPVMAAINYEALPDLWPKIRRALRADQLDAIVADESHRIKSDKAQVGNVFREMAMQSRFCFCITGTPIGNDVGDLFPQAQSVAPNLLADTYSTYMSRYAVYTNKEVYIRGQKRMIPSVVGARDMHDLMGRLSPIWFRATKAAVLDLPPKQYNEVMLDLAPNVRALYAEVEEFGEAAFDELSLSGALVRDLRLSQICGGFCPNVTANWEDPPEVGKSLRELSSPKMEWLKEFARDRLKDNPYHRVVIWCRFTATIMRVTRELESVLGRGGRVSYVVGGSPWVDDAIDSLNSRDRYGVQVIVAQPKAIREGKNIQGADSVIYVENSYSYIDRAQSEDRSHRMGRVGGIEYYDLIIRNSIDEKVLDRLAAKEDFASTSSPDTTF